MPQNYIALVPAYEPGAVLLEVLKELHQNGFEIIVVDDGSGIGYADLFLQAAAFATVLTHSVNQGKGCAIKTGLKYVESRRSSFTAVVTVDADGQHSVKDALRVCRMAEKHTDTLVLGSRKLDEKVPLRSQLGNTITRFVYRLSTGLTVYDTQTGLRAFSPALIPELLSISGDRYEYEMNVLLEFARRNIPIKEVEIETIYLDNNSASHFNTVKDSYRVYKEIIRFSASSLTGFLVDYVLYAFLMLLTSNLYLSNIGARFVSAAVNFTLNRRLVFHSSEKLLNSAVKYFLLAACILCGNTIVLELLIHTFGIHELLAKLLTELLFFVLSWFMQKTVVFRKRK